MYCKHYYYLALVFVFVVSRIICCVCLRNIFMDLHIYLTRMKPTTEKIVEKIFHYKHSMGASTGSLPWTVSASILFLLVAITCYSVLNSYIKSNYSFGPLPTNGIEYRGSEFDVNASNKHVNRTKPPAISSQVINEVLEFRNISNPMLNHTTKSQTLKPQPKSTSIPNASSALSTTTQNATARIYKTASGHTIKAFQQESLRVKHASAKSNALDSPIPIRKAPTPKIQNRTIYFLHIHRSGGSFMCSYAKQNNMTANFGNNCFVQSNHLCCGDSDTLDAQRNFATGTQFSYVASSGPMYQSMDTDSYYYATTLRNSKSRYLSQFYHHMTSVPGKMGDSSDDTIGTFLEKWLQHQPDNWNVRMICGTDCAHAPKFKISRDQWETTLSRLKNFGSILFMESFPDSYQEFANTVGWTKVLNIPIKETHYNNESESTLSKYPFMTILDDALYEFARRQMKLQKGILLSTYKSMNAYFKEGNSTECDNPCCGECWTI
jgi:hypothetical protein